MSSENGHRWPAHHVTQGRTVGLMVRLETPFSGRCVAGPLPQGAADHGFGHIDAGFVIADEATPSGYPAESPFGDPAPGQPFEAGPVSMRLPPSTTKSSPAALSANVPRSWALSANRCFSHGQRLRIADRITWAGMSGEAGRGQVERLALARQWEIFDGLCSGASPLTCPACRGQEAARPGTCPGRLFLALSGSNQ